MSEQFLTAEDKRITRALFPAAEAGDFARAEELLRDHLDVFQKRISPEHELTVLDEFLQFAAMDGDFEVLQLLVRYGGNINACEQSAGTEGVIRKAAGHGQVKIVAWLLERGAVIQQERYGHPVSDSLLMAVVGGQLEAVKLLVAAGAPINGLTNHKLTALDLAVNDGRDDIVAYLRSVGALTSAQVLAK